MNLRKASEPALIGQGIGLLTHRELSGSRVGVALAERELDDERARTCNTCDATESDPGNVFPVWDEWRDGAWCTSGGAM